MIHPDPNTTAPDQAKTDVGSVFVSNYPPYSFWRPDQVPEAAAALDAPPEPGARLGLYLHIPFCRVRCKFCYYKVFTDKDAAQVRRYLAALAREVELYAERAAVAGRPLEFIYFGGGTPSYPSSAELRKLASRLQAAIPWDGAREIAFECEPGTFTRPKLETIREMGINRLSLGVENFDDDVLSTNGRAHLSPEIFRAMKWIRELKFQETNLDLIAGMVGDTWERWQETVRKTIDLAPESVTIYQMELPYNTLYSQDVLGGSSRVALADWDVKRAWHDYAFEQLAVAGYEVNSAYTMVKKGLDVTFVYRDAVWHGTDMIGAGVASFGHMSGTHTQNTSDWGSYLERLEAGELPFQRALRTTPGQRLTREMILQLKLGHIEPAYFRAKFGADILQEFGPVFSRLEKQGMLTVAADQVRLTREGLLQADMLLPEFYAPEHRGSRYT